MSNLIKRLSLKARLFVSAAVIMVIFLLALFWRWHGATSIALAGALTLCLLASLAAMLAWLLSPLRRVAGDIQAVKMRRIERFPADYPAEILPLTDNLNAFIQLSDERLKRYRKRLDDLAHSFKTPLAVVRTTLESESNEEVLRRVVLEQVERMDLAIRYHLKRAATHGQLSMAAPVRLRAIAEKLSRAFSVKYADKSLQIVIDIDPQLTFPGNDGDLMEILGNLGDNACKAARKQVRFLAQGHGKQLLIQVDDDGPGIAREKREAVLRRGRRSDAYAEGDGIGLALVKDIAEEGYGGAVEFDRSEYGGASIRVILPDR